MFPTQQKGKAVETEAARKVREGTEVHEGGGFSLNNQEAIEHMRVMTVITGLALKINTGMNLTRGVSLTSFCASQYGTTGKTYKKVLHEMLDYYETTYGRSVDHDSVTKALAK